jgi:hypothetical protein
MYANLNGRWIIRGMDIFIWHADKIFWPLTGQAGHMPRITAAYGDPDELRDISETKYYLKVETPDRLFGRTIRLRR